MSKTPIADSLEEHGSKFYNHPRYDAKLLKQIRTLELALRRRDELLRRWVSLLATSSSGTVGMLIRETEAELGEGERE